MNLAFIQGIGPTELIIVLVIVLIIFGPKRLPALARSLGGGIKEFKDSIGSKADDDGDDDEALGRRVQTATAAREESTATAQAALGRPGEPAGEASPQGEVISERN